MIKLVILDIDDTLTMSENAWFHIENNVAKSLGLPLMDREAYRKRWGTPVREAIAMRAPKEAVEAFMKELIRVTPALVAKGEVDIITKENLKTLDEIKSLGKHLAVLTSREFFEMEHFLKPSHPLNKTIEAFYYRDNSLYLKPDPRIFNKILQDFKMWPEEALYVGDTVGDALCAKGAGLHFIALLESGLKKREDFATIPVDFFANSFPEITGYIRSH